MSNHLLMCDPPRSVPGELEAPPGQEDGAVGGSPMPPELAELMEIAEERRRLDAREARLLADNATWMACLVEFGHRVPQWLAAETKLSRSVAARRVRVAEQLHARYGELSVALEEGRVGWNHVEFFCRVANPRIRDGMIDLLPQLIALAQVASFDRWAVEVRGIAQLLDQDGGYDPNRDPANNHLRLTPTMDGALDISGRLVGELAWRVGKLVEAETERVLAQYRDDLSEQYPEGEIPPSAMPSRARATADAFVDLVERGAVTEHADGSLLAPELVVTYRSDTGDLVDADTGEHLPVSAFEWLVETGTIRPMQLSADGDPMRVGRARRFASATQRQALTIRDGGCVFPGCDRPPSWCDAHHVEPWEDGGTTDTENLALLCRHHHRVTHRPGWRMRANADGVGFRWTTPMMRTLYSQRHQRRLGSDGIDREDVGRRQIRQRHGVP